MEDKNEKRICQNCKNSFNIEPDDFSFYEKIKVPPPTFCPECRFKLCYAFRNQTSLYKRDCDLCKISIVSMYAPEKPFPVYCSDCFYSDKWDASSYGADIDFSKPFLEQFKGLIGKVPQISLIGVNKVNSDYSNHCTSVKNCYMCFSIGNSENCFYMGPQIVNDKNCCSCSMTRNSEWSHMLIDCDQCYKTSFSQNSVSCIDSSFLYNCRNCQDCIGCVNLRNKNHCIFNEQYSKEDYEIKKEELKLNTIIGIEDFKIKFEDYKKGFIRRYAVIDNAKDCIGDNITNSNNCKNCFVAVNSENTTYGFICNGAKDCFDVYHTYPSTELSYLSMAPIESNQIYFSAFLYSNCFNMFYSNNCYSSSDCFGSISLRNKNFCILNKQYTQEEYEELITKIKEHMENMPYVDKKGRIYKFGDFFPFEISPFSYNESALQEYFPITKEEAIRSGYSWRDPDQKLYQITIDKKDLINRFNDSKENIINEVIECAHAGSCIHKCSTAFRILPDELNIYNTLDIPIPTTCHNCRYAERISLRNPMKLWHRVCMCEKPNHEHEGKCLNEFETSYAPDRPEIVYCEKCYQQEVI